ncbi:MAG: dihydrolipoyl dehydrogenase [Thermoproteota archaeon]|nr:dihydrolipoyl dehydrogenase [Thermoproteota archaeon]
MQKFDLIVIGSGSGLDVANAATQNGLKVAVIEKDRMGGTCLNRGCIPSKLLIHSADVAEIIKSANLFGIEVDGLSVNFQRIVERVNGIIDHNSGQIKNAFKDIENPKLFAKECKFIGEKTILIGDNEKITAEKILIASGTRPKIPKRIKGVEGSSYITSDEALRLKKQPRVITFIGGGYITCELAHFFGSLGTEINIVQLGDALIPNEDEEISKKFTEIFSKKYNVYLGYETESVSKRKRDSDNDADSTFQIIAKNSNNQKSLELDSDQLLLAVGRIPNSDILDIEKAGVKVDEKGFIITDEYLETNVKGIFALGDAVGRYQFKHNANHESQYAFNNILHPNRKVAVDYTAMPHAIFSSPQVAGVGFTEQELKKKSIDYQRSVYPYINTGMGEAIEDRDGFVKFLVDGKSRKILGCHIIGTHASILIHEVLVAIRVGDGTIDNISRTIHIHPALSEVIARAADKI